PTRSCRWPAPTSARRSGRTFWAAFVDMLTAVETHPAMLFYLDNGLSIGPNSIAGINRDKSLNENLPREILELHTLGVRTGDARAAGTPFPSVLTGWTWLACNEPRQVGDFVFPKLMRAGGEQTVLAKPYPARGRTEGPAGLANLAEEPAAAAHIAY